MKRTDARPRGLVRFVFFFSGLVVAALAPERERKTLLAMVFGKSLVACLGRQWGPDD